QRWRRGECVPAEWYLSLDPRLPENADEALDLVLGEFVLRAERGESPTLAEFEARFPQFAGELRLQTELEQALVPSSQLASGDADTLSSLGRLAARTTRFRLAPQVPGYEILGELGRGGMGVVYKARQLSLNRLVALKMLRDGALAGPGALARFRAEAEAVARLQHPNIIQIHEVGEANGLPYFALEYVAGGSLAQHLQGAPQPARAAAALVETVARALHAANQAAIVHRDLKPANVLLRRKSEIRTPKSETNPNTKNPKPKPEGAAVSDLESSDLGFVSDFGFRISDFDPKITDFGLARLLDGAGATTEST